MYLESFNQSVCLKGKEIMIDLGRKCLRMFFVLSGRCYQTNWHSKKESFRFWHLQKVKKFLVSLFKINDEFMNVNKKNHTRVQGNPFYFCTCSIFLASHWKNVYTKIFIKTDTTTNSFHPKVNCPNDVINWTKFVYKSFSLMVFDFHFSRINKLRLFPLNNFVWLLQLVKKKSKNVKFEILKDFVY